MLRADGDRAVDKGDIEAAIQALLVHQVLYEDTPGVPRSAILALRRHAPFFERYFGAAGLRLRTEPREQMFALEGRGRLYGWKQNRLRKDETLVRLALRHVLDSGLVAGSMDELGRVATDTDELVDLFRALGKSEPPAEARLDEMLKGLARLGAVRMQERDRAERVTSFLVMPGIRVLVPDAYVEELSAWIERGCPGGDAFEALAAAAPATPATEE